MELFDGVLDHAFGPALLDHVAVGELLDFGLTRGVAQEQHLGDDGLLRQKLEYLRQVVAAVHALVVRALLVPRRGLAFEGLAVLYLVDFQDGEDAEAVGLRDVLYRVAHFLLFKICFTFSATISCALCCWFSEQYSARLPFSIYSEPNYLLVEVFLTHLFELVGLALKSNVVLDRRDDALVVLDVLLGSDG